MRIVFTGGGTGGHFYPIIAVAEEIHAIVDREKILGLKLFYFSDTPYDKEALFENEIVFRSVSAGKLRVYSSAKNFFDMFKTAFGTFGALIQLFMIYPDVVFCKGGYCSFPVVCAARLLRIPVVVHESDTVPGRVNLFAGKFAKRIAVSYDEAAQFFPTQRVAVTGQPIRRVLKERAAEGAFEYLKLDPSIPVLLVLGGSLGAEVLNNIILDTLTALLPKYQIIHQTGIHNFESVKERAKIMLEGTELGNHYLPFAFLNPLAMKMAAGASSLVISRAGSAIFEIASWGLPSILIPITESHDDHQKRNAFNYARHGGATVIEETNLAPTLFVSEVNRFFEEPARRERMAAAAKAFATPDAAEKIARVLVDIALSHES